MSPTGKSRESGFTLLELLVVMAILSLTLIVAGPSISRTGERTRLTQAEARLMAAIAEANAAARRSATIHSVTFELEKRRFRVDGRSDWDLLPNDVDLRIVTAQEVGSAGRARILFLPDGTNSGAEFTLTSGALSIERRIDWLTGRIKNAAH